MPNIKTAISIPKKLYDAADQLANQLNVSRSRVFVIAVQDLLDRHRNRQTLEQINQVIEELDQDQEEQELLGRMAQLQQDTLDEPW